LPRGASAKTYTLWPVIRCAVFVAVLLISQEDRALLRRVYDVLENDVLTTESSQLHATLVLVERALSPVLQRHEIFLSREHVLNTFELARQQDFVGLFVRYPDR